MKFCLKANLLPSYLKEADEIKIEITKPNEIESLFENYSEADIILQETTNYEWNEKKLLEWNILSRGHMVLCLRSLDNAKWCKAHDIRFYYGYAVSSYYQLEALVEAGVEYARLDAPLFFDLENVKHRYPGLKLRAVPNVAYNDGLPRLEGVCGTWMRPEDVEAYEPYIYILEFEDCDVKKESAMYRIYANDKAWPTDLGVLVTNLNYVGTNRMISSDLSRKRISCQQRCKQSGKCRLCYRLLDLAFPEKIEKYNENINRM